LFELRLVPARCVRVLRGCRHRARRGVLRELRQATGGVIIYRRFGVAHGFPLVRQLLVASLCLAALAACAPPRVVYRPAQAAVAAENSEPLEVRLRGGEQFVIRGAFVENDTLYGTRERTGDTGGSRVAAPIRDVAEIRDTNRGISAAGAGATGLVLGALAGALLLIVLLIGASSY
jgi:hypothetical protein